MINFDYKILEDLIAENRDFLLGAAVRKIQQPSRQELVFVLRNNGENKKFYINISPRFFHVCFLSPKGEEFRRLKLAQKPPMFCMLLRKYIENARIAKINQPDKERILEFYFKTTDETGEEIYLCLAIELMGKHSNVILYNYDTNVIIGCMHNVGAEKSRERELFGGLPYIYPPKRKEVEFFGLSKIKTGFTNEFIDNYFAKIIYEDKIKSIKGSLIAKLNTDLKKIKNTIAKLRQATKSIESIESYRKKGDLIMANLYSNKDFQSSISVYDYEQEKDIVIELDETQTLKENANRFYKLYNKGKISKQKNDELISELENRQNALEEKLFFVTNEEELEELESELSPHENKKHVSKIKEVNIEGFKVFIGKNSRENDYIVSKLARKEDIWFHTRLCVGSHVLLQVSTVQEPTEKVIFECAKLAKENSAGKASSKVGVIYTRFKNVKKPVGANLGYVIYKNEKEILID